MMKKYFALVLIGVIIVLVYFRSAKSPDRCVTHHGSYSVINYQLSTFNYRLLVADDPDKQSYGLMNITSKKDICGADGMIFKFGFKQTLRFWNQNTRVPLQLYWLDGKKVVGVSDMAAIDPAHGPQTWDSPALADGVIEVMR
jgi:uncharacterized membrane protein (UPF0127 family)